MTPRAYVAWVTGGCLAALAPVLLLNLMLIGNDYRFDKNRLASAWQQQTRGVTYAPPIAQNRAFKTMRLNDRIGEVNAIVFGSSTAMSITADALPAGLRLYNFAQSGNSLLSVIGEARYVLDHWSDRLRVLVIPLDWSLGFVYQQGAAATADLAAASVPPPSAPPLAARIRDALSWPRIRDLALILRDISRSPSPVDTAKQFFSEPAGQPYRCADGTPARDYDTLFRGQCVGFRDDGSATFADQKRVTDAAAAALLAQAASASSQYASALARTAGEPAAELLTQLTELAATARTRNIQIVLFMPPLLPGLDGRLAASPHSGRQLRQTKAVLQAWSQQHRIRLEDAGPSEQFGCAATDFIDPHHALPGCYRKVMARLFAETMPAGGPGK